MAKKKNTSKKETETTEKSSDTKLNEKKDTTNDEECNDDVSELTDDSNIPEEKRFVKHHNEESLEEILKNNDLVLIDFYTTWCVPCKIQSRVLEQYKDEILKVYPTMKACKLDLEKCRNLGKAFKIKFVPNLVLYYKGRFYVFDAGVKVVDDIIDFTKLLVEKVDKEITNGAKPNTLFGK